MKTMKMMKTMKTMKTNKSGLGRKGRVMLYIAIAIGVYFVVWAIIGLIM